MLRMCLSAVVLNDPLILLYIFFFFVIFLYLISELCNVFVLFIFSVLLWFVYLLFICIIYPQ